MRKNSKHMEVHWPKEMKVIQASITTGNILGQHILQQMEERDISVKDLATAIMTGKIIEGFDVGLYPNYRNPQMIRNVVGTDTLGRLLNVGVAISNNKDSITVNVLTTVYVLSQERYQMRIS